MPLPPPKPTILLLFLLCIGILSFAVLTLDYGIARASFAPGFGGPIIFVTPCVNGLLFLVAPPRPGLFMYMPPLSTLHAFFLPHPGALVLGNYFTGGACICPFFNCFAGAIPALGTVIHMGTSF